MLVKPIIDLRTGNPPTGRERPGYLTLMHELKALQKVTQTSERYLNFY